MNDNTDPISTLSSQTEIPTHSFYDSNQVGGTSQQPVTPSTASPLPQTTTQPAATTGEVEVVPPPPSQPVTPPPPPAGSNRTDLIKKIAMIGGGILGVIILLIIFFKLILPLFVHKKVEDVTLTYWGLWEDGRVINQIFNDFTRENPHIKVNYVKQDIKDYRERLVARTSNGTGPDLFRYHNTWTTPLAKLLSPLSTDTMSVSDFKKTYYPVVQQDLIQNGAIYGVPLSIDTLMLFVNSDILKAGGHNTPTTWDEFIKVAKAVTVKDEQRRIKTSGASLGTYDNITHASDVISLMLLQNGSNLSNLSGTAKNAQDALSFYTSFATGNENVWDETLEPSLSAFAKGNVAMYFGYSWDTFTLKSLNPNLSFTVNPVPNLPGKQLSIASYWVEGVSSHSKHQAEAMLLLKYLAKKEVAEKFYTETAKTRLFGEPSARVDMGESLKGNPLLSPVISQAPVAVSSFFASDTYDNQFSGTLNNYLGNAVRSMLGNTSPETAVSTLGKGVTQVFQQYGASK